VPGAPEDLQRIDPAGVGGGLHEVVEDVEVAGADEEQHAVAAARLLALNPESALKSS